MWEKTHSWLLIFVEPQAWDMMCAHYYSVGYLLLVPENQSTSWMCHNQESLCKIVSVSGLKLCPQWKMYVVWFVAASIPGPSDSVNTTWCFYLALVYLQRYTFSSAFIDSIELMVHIFGGGQMYVQGKIAGMSSNPFLFPLSKCLLPTLRCRLTSSWYSSFLSHPFNNFGLESGSEWNDKLEYFLLR